MTSITADPVKFMTENIVVPYGGALGTTQAQAGLKMMALVRSAQDGKQTGKDIPKYVLYPFQGQANAVQVLAFWCPYSQNSVLSCDLSSKARLCFTDTMDGCSFGFAADGAAGKGKVAHANAGRFGGKREATYGIDGARQFQADEQANMLNHALGGGASTIAPADYRADYDGAHVMKSTTFGVLDNGTWSFYTQRYLVQGGTYFLRGVTQQI